MLLVNGQFPGPMIEVSNSVQTRKLITKANEGDTVEITVRNHLRTQQSLRESFSL